MVDKNKNGIDDSKEKALSPYLTGGLSASAKSAPGTAKRPPGVSSYSDPTGSFQQPFKPIGIGGLPEGRYVMQNPQEQVTKVEPLSDAWRAKTFPATAQTAAAEAPKSLSDYLQQALALLGGSAGGGGVNYDPQRATARQNASEADARLEAMYRQLRGSIEADAPVIQKAYQTAIDATANTSANAQAQTQAATDAANARNDQILANLGIQQAQGNIIQQGRDLSTQTAQQIADQASRGQAAGDRLISNQATALAHNTNVGNAAGLEGNLQRASNQAKLNALLAQIDMQEQQANKSAGSDNFSKQLNLANSLLEMDRYNQEQQNSLQQSAAKLANDRYVADLQAQSKQLPDLGTYLQSLGLDINFVKNNPRDAASLLGSLRRYSITQ